MPRWKARLIKALGGVVREGGTYVADSHWERTEELRPDRLGPDENLMDQEGWQERRNADPYRPSTTLGPLP